MTPFVCDNCDNPVFFENDRCLKCDSRLGFEPEQTAIVSLRSAEAGRFVTHAEPHSEYAACQNAIDHNLCNWLVSPAEKQSLCVACRLTEVIPDLSVEGNLARWQKLELNKRRVLYTLLRLGLATEADAASQTPSLRFQFLADKPEAPVMTGHAQGMVTINIAEADDDERERRRVNLREPYRTLVGHFRHELGHYFWDRLIARSPELGRFREIFGDETADYQRALQKYHAEGPSPDWSTRTITAYASAHPWEDWAETWAHYLHLFDTMETAAAVGLKLGPKTKTVPSTRGTIKQPRPQMSFDDLWQNWHPVILALNLMNRSMGLPDLYPFVVPPPALEKLRFVHRVIRKHVGTPTGDECQPNAAT